jgi:hypothetical protein
MTNINEKQAKTGMYILLGLLLTGIIYLILKKFGLFKSKEQRDADKTSETDDISKQLAVHNMLASDPFNASKSNTGTLGDPDSGIDSNVLIDMSKLVHASMSQFGVITGAKFLNDPTVMVGVINQLNSKKMLSDLGYAYFSLYGSSLTDDCVKAYNDTGLAEINQAISKLQ